MDRRKKYFDQFEYLLGGNHQELLLLIKNCLNNLPLLRPSSQDLVTQLKAVKAGAEKKRGSVVLQKSDISKALLTREMAEREKNMKELEVSNRHATYTIKLINTIILGIKIYTDQSSSCSQSIFVYLFKGVCKVLGLILCLKRHVLIKI